MNAATILSEILDEMKALRAEVISVRAELAAIKFANPEAVSVYSAADWAVTRNKEFDEDTKKHLGDREWEVFCLLRKAKDVQEKHR